MRRLLTIALFALALPALLLPAACDKERYADERDVKLDFSADTVSFDTVFTTMGTATLQVRVYNRTLQDIELSAVTLEQGRASRFRLNVDGDTSLVARHVELQAGDSLFIFIQACIDPSDATTPFLVEDAIVFSNGQRLPLTAWGRNAVYHALRSSDTTWYIPLDCAAWDHSRPHVILGAAAVLDGNTLNLTAGDELHFGPDAMLIIDSNASLVAVGTAEHPVLFTSVRHDPWYRALPGQWQMVWLYNCSTGNIVDHALFENGTDGLRGYPGSQLTVSNTVVRNMSDAAFVGQNATMQASNLLVYDCYTSLALIGGGSYSFDRCTLADYWSYRGKSRDTASVIISNYYPLSPTEYYGADMQQADFSRCIIYGSHRSEVSVNQMPGFGMNYSFDRCLVRGGDWDEDPRFVDVQNDDYHLQDDSPALGIGYPF